MRSDSVVAGSLGALLIAAVLAACGGSSSETPPPLEPGPDAVLRSTPKAVEGAAGAESSDDEPERATRNEAPADPSAAPKTWGR
jgi:hypothetical protein